MTNEQFRQRLSKYHLNLVCVPWGDTKHTFNLDKSVKQALDINSFPKEHSGGIIDESSKNNFVGMFAPKFLYLITAYPDNEYLPKDANKVMHMIHTDGVNQYVVAQIDATHRNLWQRDNHYRPTDYKLWKLVKSFVYTPIVQRDKNKYVLISYKNVSGDRLMGKYNLLAMLYDDEDNHISYNNFYFDADSIHDGGDNFFLHFPLSFIKNYLKSHHGLSDLNDDNYQPLKKIVPVKDDISYVRHKREASNRIRKTQPKIKWDYMNIFDHSFKGHKHHLLMKLSLANKAYQSAYPTNSIYDLLIDVLKFREWGIHKIKDNALKSIYCKLKTKPKALMVSAKQVHWLSESIDNFNNLNGYGSNSDDGLDYQTLDDIMCILNEFYFDQKGE